MRIALDGTPLTVSTGGAGRYTAELARALAQSFPDDQIWLLSDQPFPAPAGDASNLHCAPGPRVGLDRRWWLVGASRECVRLGIDVFHGTDFSVPYLPLRPSVLSLLDLSLWKDPLWHQAADRVRRRTPFLLRLGLATMVITLTEAVRREAIQHFLLPPGRVVAVPLAASDHFRPVAASPPEKPYFLYVGTLEPRKNVPLILAAWREVRRRHDVDLALAGRRRADFPEIAAEPGLRVLGETPDAALPALYSQALACLYPSLYEGFGLPVLEAMQCGAAVFTSRDPAVVEVAGDAALTLDARDSKPWVEAMEVALTTPGWLTNWRRKALRRAAQFSWTRTAQLTRGVYDEARRRFQ